MKVRLLMFAAVVFAATMAALGQANYAGKWQTEDVPDVQAGKSQARVGQTMILDLKLDGAKASGTMNEIGNGDPLTIESGTLDTTAKTLTIVTQPRGVTWHIALTDENTMTVTSRDFAGGGRGGGGGRGPGGGAPGGGGPGGGAPAAGGTAPAAPPAPAAGAAPAGGAGGPGGPGGAPAAGGGVRGGGRGAAGGQPIVLHRVK
jgi:hypothetical protein